VLIFGSFELVHSLEESAFVMYRKHQHHVSSYFFSLLFFASVFNSLFLVDLSCC